VDYYYNLFWLSFFGLKSTLLARQLPQERTQMEAPERFFGLANIAQVKNDYYVGYYSIFLIFFLGFESTQIARRVQPKRAQMGVQ